MTNVIVGKQHIVFGAGLIGCYLGGVFTTLGLNTTLVCREHVKDKLQAGMRLTDYQNHQTRVPQLDTIQSGSLFSDAAAATKADFLWLTVKCTGIEQAVKDAAPFVTEQTTILCCQNGLGSDAAVKQAYPNNVVLRVMVPFNVVELSAGHYHRGSEGFITIERTPATTQIVEVLVNTLNSELLPIDNTANMSELLWAKLQLNLGNSVNALADIPVKAMLEQRDYRKVIALLMSELLQVTDTLGIKLPKITALSAHKIPMVLRLPNFIFTRVANKMLAIDPNVRSSMWWDVSQGKPTEIDHINGAILEHAKNLGIKCPANEKIRELINQLNPDTTVSSDVKHPIGDRELLRLLVHA
jgi:2-dehydropantoate 2-reductase